MKCEAKPSIWRSEAQSYVLFYTLRGKQVQERNSDRSVVSKSSFFLLFLFRRDMHTFLIYFPHRINTQSRLLSVILCIAPHFILSLITNLYFSNGVKYTSLKLFFHEVQIQFSSSQALKDHTLLYPK